jgi:3'-phosphoadenosine 5'-phosphosulfate sulfotransferase (PAPS reductase)/FAD synthetase
MGAAVFGSVSGGKDGQGMMRTLKRNKVPIAGMIHCDLGRAEWPQSLGMCQRQADEYGIPLHVLRRADGLGLVEYMRRRLRLLAGTGKPFWPSAKARYCTSDLKRGPSNAFFRKCGHNLIISAEGIRAEESTKRAKKKPLSVRDGVTSDYYTYIAGTNKKGKPIRKFYTVEHCLEMYRPDKRLVLNWYPVFNMLLEEVWETYGVSRIILNAFRTHYRVHGFVHPGWPFHPAYVMGNDRVSCRLCILGSLNDLENGAREAPDLLEEYISMEDEGGATFKDKFSLKQLRTKL